MREVDSFGNYPRPHYQLLPLVQAKSQKLYNHKDHIAIKTNRISNSYLRKNGSYDSKYTEQFVGVVCL